MKMPIKRGETIVISSRISLLTYEKLKGKQVNISKLVNDYLDKVAAKLYKHLEGE